MRGYSRPTAVIINQCSLGQVSRYCSQLLCEIIACGSIIVNVERVASSVYVCDIETWTESYRRDAADDRRLTLHASDQEGKATAFDGTIPR